MAEERKYRVSILILVLTLWFGFSSSGSLGGIDSKAQPPVFIIPYFDVPGQVDLCGEDVPLKTADVRERFDREFTLVVHSHAQVYLWLKRAERYFPWVERQLKEKGLPEDLKFVAVAESDLTNGAVSSAGAAGPWQFMAGTAGNYGMNQSAMVDERYDFEVSASGAFKYLANLYGQFQNWPLAIAAYNCGEKRVHDEMRKQKVQSYFLLKLPRETERYVFRILAIKEVLSNPEKYGYYLPKGAGYPVITFEKVNISLPGPITVTAAAEAAGITYREFKLLNPSLITDMIPKGNLTVKVPDGKGKEFEKRIEVLKSQYKPVLVVHRVAKGETLEGIAHKYDATVQDIGEWNKIKGSKIRPGQMLKIYK